jgi:hypothetical protein
VVEGIEKRCRTGKVVRLWHGIVTRIEEEMGGREAEVKIGR